jgi:hypothetical protein
MNDRSFNEVLEGTERIEWEALKFVADTFLGRQSGQLQTAG